MFKPVLAASLALATTFAAVAPASAQEVRRVEVRYGDLDLSRRDAMAALHARVRAALDTVCGETDRHDLAGSIFVARCRTDAMKDANKQIAANQVKAASLLASR
jgi:UrcA family protein